MRERAQLTREFSIQLGYIARGRNILPLYTLTPAACNIIVKKIVKSAMFFLGVIFSHERVYIT